MGWHIYFTILFSVMEYDFGHGSFSNSIGLIHCVFFFFFFSLRVVRKPKAKKVEEYDSDDPACYKNEEIPDKVTILQIVLRILWTACVLCVKCGTLRFNSS